MKTPLQRGRVRLAGAAAGLGLMTVAASAAGGASGTTIIPANTCSTPAGTPAVVMCGLDNPRGLSFGPQGALYVAEAGRGGLGIDNPLCFIGQAVGAKRCYGPTGAVSRLWRGVQERVAKGLPSQARASDGGNAIGPHDISMLGVGSADVTIGLQQPPALRDELAAKVPETAGFAQLARVEPSGKWRYLADLGAYEALTNPDGGPLDTNPYGLAAVPGGELVTDAGGNSLLRVDANGEISTLAVFQSRGTHPPRPSFAVNQFTDAVPTSVAVGPDGAYYVGELTGDPFVDRKANVYRVVPGEAPRLFLIDDACLTGFKMIIDLAFDADGNLYVLQYTSGPGAGPGALIRITRDRSQAGGICAEYEHGAHELLLGGRGEFQLSHPTSVVVGPDGAIYVTNHGDVVDQGEVLRIEP